MTASSSLSVLCCFLSLSALASGSLARPVAVFPWSEHQFHKYSAVLAAAEPFRLQREDNVKRSISFLQYVTYKLRGTDLNDPNCPLRRNNFLVDRACRAYEDKANEIVSAYGLDPASFNNISRELSRQPQLRQQVMLQTYYYRIAADLEANTKPPIPLIPIVAAPRRGLPDMNRPWTAAARIKTLLTAGRSRDISTDDDLTVKRFCRALQMVEKERQKQLLSLQNKLHGGKTVPSTVIFSPDVLPLMSRDVQKAFAAFPTQAEKIIRNSGMSPSEFSFLLNSRMKEDRQFKKKVDELLRLNLF